MDKEMILSHVDHTLLKPVSTWEQIETLCKEALSNNTASVCIPPCYVKKVHETFKELNVCTVIGFPLGYETTEGKIADAKYCIENGASEIDIVINICFVKNKDFDSVYEEVAALRKITEGHILKVIVETCYLTEEEKIKLCQIVTKAGADYIKTSTGFGTNGATIEDIRLFKQNIGPNVKIKASGGIRTIKDATLYIEEGCDRIGASAIVDAVKEM